MVHVHQFHADLLMNVKGLRDYLSQTAPVPYQRDGFHFASQIEKHLSGVGGYCSYSVMLNGSAVTRPYQLDVMVREGTNDSIRDIELVDCVSREGRLLCRGWFAHMGFLSALPRQVTMRGIRIRQGNIAVGDEYFLKDLFTESRFATWHIGELHITPVLKLNARRDGFEESPEYEDFLEWAAVLCRRLSGLCRQSSKDRSTQQSIARLRDELEYRLSTPFFVDEEHATRFFETAEQQLARLRRITPDSGHAVQQVANSFGTRLARLKERPVFLRSMLDGRALRGKDNRQLLIDLCTRILSINHGFNTSEALMEVVRPYLRGHQAD